MWGQEEAAMPASSSAPRCSPQEAHASVNGDCKAGLSNPVPRVCERSGFGAASGSSSRRSRRTARVPAVQHICTRRAGEGVTQQTWYFKIGHHLAHSASFVRNMPDSDTFATNCRTNCRIRKSESLRSTVSDTSVRGHATHQSVPSMNECYRHADIY